MAPSTVAAGERGGVSSPGVPWAGELTLRRSPICFARPQSTTRVSPYSPSMILAGLMSR
jgi:hypothetical protein